MKKVTTSCARWILNTNIKYQLLEGTHFFLANIERRVTFLIMLCSFATFWFSDFMFRDWLNCARVSSTFINRILGSEQDHVYSHIKKLKLNNYADRRFALYQGHVFRIKETSYILMPNLKMKCHTVNDKKSSEWQVESCMQSFTENIPLVIFQRWHSNCLHL